MVVRVCWYKVIMSCRYREPNFDSSAINSRLEKQEMLMKQVVEMLVSLKATLVQSKQPHQQQHRSLPPVASS